jgi:hypothetical protein
MKNISVSRSTSLPWPPVSRVSVGGLLLRESWEGSSSASLQANETVAPVPVGYERTNAFGKQRPCRFLTDHQLLHAEIEKSPDSKAALLKLNTVRARTTHYRRGVMRGRKAAPT